MSERNFRAELKAGQCKPNHGCNVAGACMCALAEEAIDDNDRLLARVAELIALHIQVVYCGGQCSAELLAKIERATQEEAGWTDIAGGAPVAAHAHSDVLIAEPPSSRRGEPAPATESEVMPDSGTETRQRSEHNAQPRPAQSPAGAFYCSDYGFMVTKVCDSCDCQHGPKHA